MKGETNEITCERFVKMLKRLPEKKFRIMELAPQLIDEKGRIDIVKCIDRQPELNTAILEVQNYVKQVKELFRIVLYIQGKDPEKEDMEEEVAEEV